MAAAIDAVNYGRAGGLGEALRKLQEAARECSRRCAGYTGIDRQECIKKCLDSIMKG